MKLWYTNNSPFTSYRTLTPHSDSWSDFSCYVCRTFIIRTYKIIAHVLSVLPCYGLIIHANPRKCKVGQSMLCYRAFSSCDHNPYTRNKLAILVYNLYSTSLAVYTIAIETPTGKRLYSCFILCSSCFLSDSTHIRSIISISLISWRSP